MIEQKEVPARTATEFVVKGKTEEGTEWRGQNESQIERKEKRSGKLVGAAETSKEREEWHRLQWKNLNILGLLKRKEWPQCHRESNWQVCQSCLCQKEKEQSHQSKTPDHKGGRESRWVRAAPWRERGRSEREHEEERADSTVKKDRFQGGPARRASLGEVKGSMNRLVNAKALQEDLHSWFHS